MTHHVITEQENRQDTRTLPVDNSYIQFSLSFSSVSYSYISNKRHRKNISIKKKTIENMLILYEYIDIFYFSKSPKRFELVAVCFMSNIAFKSLHKVIVFIIFMIVLSGHNISTSKWIIIISSICFQLWFNLFFSYFLLFILFLNWNIIERWR